MSSAYIRGSEFDRQLGRSLIYIIKRSGPRIPHSINYEETGTSEGLWNRLGRRKMTNMSFFDVFKAPSFALVNSAS